MFVQEHAMGFLCLCNLVSKKRHKATTPDGIPQGKGICDGTICKLVLYLVCYLDGSKFI